jgi:hypothetical protein
MVRRRFGGDEQVFLQLVQVWCNSSLSLPTDFARLITSSDLSIGFQASSIDLMVCMNPDNPFLLILSLDSTAPSQAQSEQASDPGLHIPLYFSDLSISYLTLTQLPWITDLTVLPDSPN